MILKKKWTPGAHLLLKCYLKGKISRKLANGQNIDYSEKKENGPRASSAPALGLNTIIFKYVYWYMKQISGERLQDHWSSGFVILAHNCDLGAPTIPQTRKVPRSGAFLLVMCVLWFFSVPFW